MKDSNCSIRSRHEELAGKFSNNQIVSIIQGILAEARKAQIYPNACEILCEFIEKIELSDYLQILKGSVIRTGCPNSGKSSLGCAIARILKCKKSPDSGNIWKFVSDTQPKFQFFCVAMVDACVFGRLPTLPPPPMVDSGSDDTSLLDGQARGLEMQSTYQHMRVNPIVKRHYRRSTPVYPPPSNSHK